MCSMFILTNQWFNWIDRNYLGYLFFFPFIFRIHQKFKNSISPTYTHFANILRLSFNRNIFLYFFKVPKIFYSRLAKSVIHIIQSGVYRKTTHVCPYACIEDVLRWYVSWSESYMSRVPLVLYGNEISEGFDTWVFLFCFLCIQAGVSIQTFLNWI